MHTQRAEGRRSRQPFGHANPAFWLRHNLQASQSESQLHCGSAGNLKIPWHCLVLDVASHKVLAHKVAIALEAVNAKKVIEQRSLGTACPISSTPTRAASSRPVSSPTPF
jgi:hypothetical protein